MIHCGKVKSAGSETSTDQALFHERPIPDQPLEYITDDMSFLLCCSDGKTLEQIWDENHPAWMAAKTVRGRRQRWSVGCKE